MDGVGGTEQAGYLGAKAPVGESGDGVERDAQGAEQGNDPRVAEPQGRGPPPVGGERGERDPRKGWARKDTTLPDTFTIEQAAVDVRALDCSSSRWARRRGTRVRTI